MRKTVHRYIREFNLLRDLDPVVVSVSGGADSMSLLHVLYELGHKILVVHFDHQLRGRESDQDASCVASYCDELGVPFVLVRLGDELGKRANNGSVQARARRLRYKYLRQIAAEKEIGHVAVAHNLNDQAETVLLNLKRGTGLDGMAGMRPTRELNTYDFSSTSRTIKSHGFAPPIHLIRPFLRIRRRDIEDYVSEQQIPWRDDSSNRDMRYTRNRIRYKIIPELQGQGQGKGQVQVRGADFIDDIAQSADAVAKVVDVVIPRSLPEPLQNWMELDRRLPLEPLRSLPETVRSWLYLRAVRNWLPGSPVRSTTVAAIESLLKSQPGKKVQFQTGRIWRERTSIYFEQRPLAYDSLKNPDIQATELKAGIPIQMDNSFLSLEFISCNVVSPELLTLGEDRSHVSLDCAKIKGPLRVRYWRAGDRFIPLGMNGSKKVKSYLTDVKVSPSKRSGARVVCDDEKIVWLVGHRLDNRVRLDAGSKRVAKLSVKQAT